MTGYTVFCGNFDCETRRPGTSRTFQVTHLPDGKVWVCPVCRSSTDAAAWPARHPCPCGTVYDHCHSVSPELSRRR